MAIEVFNRHENKYIIKYDTYKNLENEFMKHMQPDLYNIDNYTYPILNIYYDTVGNDLIRTSISKPRYKEKVRMRAYGVPDMDTNVFVEIKKKVSGFVNKRRTIMPLSEAYRFMENKMVDNYTESMNAQVIEELKYILNSFELMPRLFLSYERRALFGIDQKDLRISFDTDIFTRRSDLLLESGCYGTHLLEENMGIMEIKVARSIPVWLSNLLSENNIFPRSISKYGTEYLKTIDGCMNEGNFIASLDDFRLLFPA